MQRTDPKKVANAYHIYSRLLLYVRRYWFALVLATVGSMVYSGIDAWFISFLKPLLNRGLVDKNEHFLSYAPLLVMGVFMLRGVASFVSNYYMTSASRNVIMQLRQDLFAHLQRLPAKFYDHHSTGHLLAVLLYSVEQVSNASADVLTTAVQSLFLIVGLLYVMFHTSWKLTLLYFILLPLVTVIMRVTSLRIRRLNLGIQDSIGYINHSVEENIEGYKAVRAFHGQEYEMEKFNKLTRMNRQREMKVVVTRSISVSLVQVITAIALALTLYIATFDVSSSLLSPGGFIVMVAAMLALLKPMKDLATVQNKLYRGVAGAQRVFELMDEPAEIDAGTKEVKRAKGKIQFSHINFSYQNGRKVLDDVSFSVEPGTIVALVGRSGSGKSTLVSMLPRYYDVQSGHLLIDDVSVNEYKLANLRQQFAIVSQNVTLFHDTIANNIAYGSFNKATKEDIYAAAKAAHALEFIEKLPEGMDSMVGENGVLLSGGQRQRIAIARAVLKDAPILILDEATSALDTESERYIQLALDELMKSRTTLVIAHRLSTVEHADKIIVMDEGRIIETGTHQELLNLDGHYARLYRMQFKDHVNDTVEAVS